MGALDISLYLASPVILVGLVVIFLRRRLNRQFPLFFAYMLYVPLTAVARISVVHHALVHFWVHWGTEAAYGIFALLVQGEVLFRVFPIEHTSYRWFRWLLPTAVPLILGFTFLETRYHPLGHGQISTLVAGIYWFDVGAHLLEGLILMIVLVLTGVFPVAWQRQEFGILAGFGVNACVTMIASLFRFELGSGYETFFRYGPPFAYLLATLIWLHAFLHPPKPDYRDPQIGPDEMLDEVGRAKELLRWIERLLGLRREGLYSR